MTVLFGDIVNVHSIRDSHFEMEELFKYPLIFDDHYAYSKRVDET